MLLPFGAAIPVTITATVNDGGATAITIMTPAAVLAYAVAESYEAAVEQARKEAVAEAGRLIDVLKGARNPTW